MRSWGQLNTYFFASHVTKLTLLEVYYTLQKYSRTVSTFLNKNSYSQSFNQLYPKIVLSLLKNFHQMKKFVFGYFIIYYFSAFEWYLVGYATKWVFKCEIPQTVIPLLRNCEMQYCKTLTMDPVEIPLLYLTA